MATLRSSIALYDGMTSPLQSINRALHIVLNSFEAVQRASGNVIDTDSLQQAREELARTEVALNSIEEEIRRADGQQQRFNRNIRNGGSAADGLWKKMKGVAATVGGIAAVKKIIDVSDELASTNARLNLIVEDGGSVEELEKKIMASAQRSRSAYFDVASSVASLASNAGAAFSGNDEVVAFMEQVNKQFVIGGASAEGQKNAMIQLTQAMAAGALRGEELNSILEQAPGIARAIERYMGIAEGSIKSVAEEGQVTSEIVKNALFSIADETNEKFESMPMTWAQIWISMQNQMLSAFSPVLNKLNEVANSADFQRVFQGAIDALSTLAAVAAVVFDALIRAGSFLVDNWSWIGPIIYGVAAAFAVYNGYLIANNVIQAISNGLKTIAAIRAVAHGSATAAEAAATVGMTEAQLALNAAFYNSPIARIILLIIVLIAVIYAAASAIAKFTGVANSGFGVITGGINVVIQFFKNLGLTVANIAIAIAKSIAAVASNIKTAFFNAIHKVQSWFFDLLSTALTVVEKICAALNKLPFVEFDYSGISSAADRYAQESAEAAGQVEEYESVKDAFRDGMSTFDTFQDGWVPDAFKAGAAWGDGIADKVSGLFDFDKHDPMGADSEALNNLLQDNTGSPQAFNAGNALDDICGSTGDTAENTAAMRNSLSASEKELKYLREIAEREAINRFTTAEIKVEMVNQNTITGTDDIDGILSELEARVEEAMIEVSEGTHI